jgi:hypothetical protein
MRKVGNRSLLVTTSVPGHHRPLITKQLKCQALHCGIEAWTGNWPPAPDPSTKFNVRQRRAGVGGKRRDSSPNYARIHSSPRPASSGRLKPRQSQAIFIKKAGRPRNLGNGPSVSQSSDASQEAKSEMPTIYTPNDFALSRLHQRSAETISISVTSRERVGRSMS